MKVDSVSSAANIQAILASATQELMETASQTKTEALKGDMQAVRKLAHLQAQQPEPTAAAAPNDAPDSTGTIVNVKR